MEYSIVSREREQYVQNERDNLDVNIILSRKMLAFGLIYNVTLIVPSLRQSIPLVTCSITTSSLPLIHHATRTSTTDPGEYSHHCTFDPLRVTCFTLHDLSLHPRCVRCR